MEVSNGNHTFMLSCFSYGYLMVIQLKKKQHYKQFYVCMHHGPV